MGEPHHGQSLVHVGVLQNEDDKVKARKVDFTLSNTLTVKYNVVL